MFQKKRFHAFLCLFRSYPRGLLGEALQTWYKSVTNITKIINSHLHLSNQYLIDIFLFLNINKVQHSQHKYLQNIFLVSYLLKNIEMFNLKLVKNSIINLIKKWCETRIFLNLPCGKFIHYNTRHVTLEGRFKYLYGYNFIWPNHFR